MKRLNRLWRFGFLLNSELASLLIQPGIELKNQITRVYLIFQIILHLLITISQEGLIFS